ncbi:MAG: hypothetical protein Q4F71_00680 [Paracoccus sp. (in: a-proteobacteria)]|nr:hypothetical protein [Paracoccus sp. (in: a-proteobacteria)]
MNLTDRLFAALDDPAHGWSMGSFGAIAEFHRDPDEPLLIDAPGLKATAKGAIRLDPAQARAVAYETLSPKAGRWSQSVALCLPRRLAVTAQRAVLTRLGPDMDAIRPEDRSGILFDMGLGQLQVDLCIRTADAALIAVLEAAEGRDLFDPGNPAMGAILAAHPHRVALTPLGRIEVFQMIGGPDTGGVSPPGPHTHVLPKLLRTGRTHSANAPIPDRLVPCAGFHPQSPISTPMGLPRPFAPVAFAAFQRLLLLWGVPEHVAVKEAAFSALRGGRDLSPSDRPRCRIGRTALRIAMRQWQAQGNPLPAGWAAFDRAGTDTAEAEPHEQGH